MSVVSSRYAATGCPFAAISQPPCNQRCFAVTTGSMTRRPGATKVLLKWLIDASAEATYILVTKRNEKGVGGLSSYTEVI